MKFGRYLKDHAISEWSTKYINYRQLKKAIHSAADELEQEDSILTASPTSTSPIRQSLDLELGQQGNDTDDTRIDELERGMEADVEDEDEGGDSMNGMGKKITFATSSLRRQSNASQNRTTSDGNVRPRRPSFTRTKGSKLSVRNQSLFTLNGDVVPKSYRFEPTLPLDDLIRLLSPASKKVFELLDDELEKVGDFFDEREADAIKRYRELKGQWQELEDHKKEYQEFRDRTGINLAPKFFQPTVSALSSSADNSARLRSNATASTSKASVFQHNGPASYGSAKAALKLATFEFYRSLGMLKTYKVLNQTGFTKILKKIEKETQIPCAAYTEKLNEQHWITSKTPEDIARHVEDGFAKVFEHGNRKAALDNLRNLGNQKTHHFASFRSGLYLGISIPLLLHGIILSSQFSTQLAIPYWKALLQLFGAMFLPILFSLLFYTNLLTWHHARINYVLIFELDVRTMTDFRQYLCLPSLLCLIFSISFWLSFNNFWPGHISPSTYPLVFLVIAMIVLFNPLPNLNASARWWMIRSMSRVVTAGLVRVEFRDFFLGDELSSLYYPIYNLGFLVCTYRQGWPADVVETCSPNHNFVTAALASLPSFFRLGQSLRRYVDSDGLQIHALNAGKYTCSIIYFFLYFNWRISGSSISDINFALWIIIAVINSSYTTTWDLLMDWSLFRKNSTHPGLRAELGFKESDNWYYFAIVTNVLLRFSWIIYLPTSPVPSVQLRGYIVAVLEVCRRIQWNTIRVESEHVGNVDGYRVTRTVPLPYTNIYSLPKAPETSLAEESDQSRPYVHRVFAALHALHLSLSDNLAPVFALLPDWQFNFGDEETRKANMRQGKTRERDRRGAGEGKAIRLRTKREPFKRSSGTAVDTSSNDDDDGDDDDRSEDGERRV